jgi:hypothetical protein
MREVRAVRVHIIIFIVKLFRACGVPYVLGYLEIGKLHAGTRVCSVGVDGLMIKEPGLPVWRKQVPPDQVVVVGQVGVEGDLQWLGQPGTQPNWRPRRALVLLLPFSSSAHLRVCVCVCVCVVC